MLIDILLLAVTTSAALPGAVEGVADLQRIEQSEPDGLTYLAGADIAVDCPSAGRS